MKYSSKARKTLVGSALGLALASTYAAWAQPMPPASLVRGVVATTLAQTSPVSSAPAKQPATSGDEARDRGWPRLFEADGHEVIVYQPQVDDWTGFDRITFRSAISVGPKGGQGKVFGILRMSADTKVSVEDRLVVLTSRKLEEVTFPEVQPAEAQRLEKIVAAATPPDRPQTISLDRLISALNPAQLKVRTVELNLAPPRIFSSTRPAVLVVFLGKPRFQPVPGSDLLFATNTNWDVFLDPGARKYYLLNGRSWFSTDDLSNGPWIPASTLPPSLSKLPADDNWSDVRAAIPGEPPNERPVVYVSNEPAELIVTDGAPELEQIPGTGLMLVVNTDSNLVYNAAGKEYYLLSAGRWFKSSRLEGPWLVASGSLPADFKLIPEDSDAGQLLAAVPGTAAANEAIVMASIPEKATINRTEVTVKVTYDGNPVFKPIESTEVQYAFNSPFNVFLVNGQYYCCHNAVWFVAPTPTGVWTVCDSVPAAIYTIPPSSPKHNVTYVTVYESTPTTVVTGYTSGYSGATVAATGVVMFGLGLLVGAALDDDNNYSYYRYHYHSGSFSYGCGAVWHGGSGGYVCASTRYGPYGGAGHMAAYNPATGVYSRGGYAYGPNGASGYRTAYNPSTGAAGARAGATTPYGSWGRSAVTNGDEWVRGGHKTTSRGSVGAVEGSGGGGAITAQGRYGNGATLGKTAGGDYYAASDGNVYKKSEGGDWEQTRNSPRGSGSGSSTPPSTRPSGTASATAAPHTSGELESHATARDRGEKNDARSRESRSAPTRSAPASRGGGRRGR